MPPNTPLTDLQALFTELEQRLETGRQEDWPRAIEILEIMLELTTPGDADFELVRVHISGQLATLLAQGLEVGMIEPIATAQVLTRCHALHDEALGILRRHQRWIEVANTAQDQANLLQREFDAGDGSAAARAHALYDEALEIRRRHQRWIDVAHTAHNQAALLTSAFRAGDGSAAARAHALYDEALEIRRRHQQWIDVAQTATSQATLLTSAFRAGDGSAAARAHALYDEALEILRRHQRWIDVARTAHNQAALLTSAFRAGDGSAAARAHALYDEALEIRRRHQQWIDVAATAQNQALLLASEFDAGDGSAAARAHALYDEALEISRRHQQWITVAATAQNQALLLASEFDAGDGSAAARAHALYDEALEIRRRHQRWIEVANTAQNQALLLESEFDAGDGSAAARAHALYDEGLFCQPFLSMPIGNMRIRKNLLRLIEREEDWQGATDLIAAMQADVSKHLPTIANPRNRRRLLQEIGGLGMRGASAALSTGDIGRAVRLLEAGRAVELGRRLRETEAALAPDQRTRLTEMRRNLERAATAQEHCLEALGDDRPDPEGRRHADVLRAKADLESLWAAFETMRQDFGFTHPAEPPNPDAVRRALGPGTAVVLPWYVPGGGGVLMLTPAQAGWSALDCPELTEDRVAALQRAWFDAYGGFRSEQLTSAAFSAAIDQCRNELWHLLMGPIHGALKVAGDAAVEGAIIAQEVVVIPPPALSVLPLASAADPLTGRCFLDDYAVSQLPSLQACLSAAARARRPYRPSLVAVTNPQDDLEIQANPALAVIPWEERIDLTGYRGDPARHPVATADGLREMVARRSPGCFSYYGHGGWDPDDSDNSALYLASDLVDGAIPRHSPAGPTIGAAFNARALRGLDLASCRLAVLAGCETGMIDLNINPDEFIGLPAAVLEADAAAVVATRCCRRGDTLAGQRPGNSGGRHGHRAWRFCHRAQPGPGDQTSAASATG